MKPIIIQHSAFLVKNSKKSKDVIETNWLEVELFQRFEEWFRERTISQNWLFIK